MKTFKSQVSPLEENILMITNNKIKAAHLEHRDEILVEIASLLKQFKRDMTAKNELEHKEVKWKHAALVFDRLFFFLSLFGALVTFSSIIMSSPDFYKPVWLIYIFKFEK